MTLEKAGRADKQGNVYENRYLAKMLLRLVAGEIKAIVVEPLGEDLSICEFYTIEKNGKKVYYQCKAGNEGKDHWTPGDLQRYNLFSRVYKLFKDDINCEFRFVSPLYYSGIDDLCDRAKRCSTAEEFVENALSNKALKNTFQSCENYLHLHGDDKAQLSETVWFFSKCEFIVAPFNSEIVRELDQYVSLLFCGNTDGARVLLENYVNDTAAYGKDLSASDVLRYLENKGIELRPHFSSTLVAPAIKRINNLFLSSYLSIGGTIVHRNATEQVLREVEAGRSVVIHGKAGVGKSGCVRELIKKLEQKGIDYLAIQLDKHIPKECADSFGKTLGLSESPAMSLHNIAGHKPSVLILDQLDALRWTSLHSSVALDVCKEMIEQVNILNEKCDGHISVVFSVRTFDYETDAGIRTLFESQNKKREEHGWTVVRVGELTDVELSNIIGEERKALPARVNELLRVPSSLYVWLKLGPERRMNQISSAQEMVSAWWRQIQDHFSSAGFSCAELTECINRIVSAVEKTESYSLPYGLFMSYQRAIDYLVSGGMLLKENENISFAHQSFLEFFLLEKDLTAIYSSEKTVLSLVLSWGTQMPLLRYRLSAILQNVMDANQSLFVVQAEEILQSSQIRFYYKATVFEIIGQLLAPDSMVYKLVDKYYAIEEWHKFIFHTVFVRHTVFIKHLSNTIEMDWLSEEGKTLLRSISEDSPAFVESALRPLLEKKDISSKQLLSVLGTGIDYEPDGLFNLRMDVYKRDPSLIAEIHFINFDTVQGQHLTDLFRFILSNNELLGATQVHYNGAYCRKFYEENYTLIVKSLFEPVCTYAKDTPLSLHNQLGGCKRYWMPKQHEKFFARIIVETVKESLKILARNNPVEAMDVVKESGKYKNGITNELILSSLVELPIEYSDFVIQWILEDFDNHIIDCIGNEHDYLATCKEIIKKHTMTCSDELFSRIEDAICNWKGDREGFLNEYRYRLECNQDKKYGVFYWPLWGHLQKDLLPMLNSNRIKNSTKELISVLQRNSWVRACNYHAGVLCGEAKTVVSTIHKNVLRLSDKTWLSIVCADVKEKHYGVREGEDGESYYYESSHWLFAQDFASCMDKDPVRYASLLLKFPKNSYEGYFSAGLNSISNDREKRIPFELLCNVIRYCKDVDSRGVSMSILRIIEGRAEEDWPYDIIDFVIEEATGENRGLVDEITFPTRIDDPFPSVEDVEITALNHCRTVAINAVAKLISKHEGLLETFSGAIDSLLNDKSDVVLYSLVECAVASYQWNPVYAKGIFDSLLKTSYFCACSRYSLSFICSCMAEVEDKYLPILIHLCSVENPKVAIHVVRLICNIGIITRNKKVLGFLYSNPWSAEFLDKICLEATYAFEKEEYKDICRDILEHCLEVDAKSIPSVDRLFHSNGLDAHRDKSLIILILKKRRNIETVIDFIEFIKSKDCEMGEYAEIIKAAVYSIDDNAEIWQSHILEEGLIHTIIKMIDMAKDDESLQEYCLEIIDEIYRRRIFTNTAIMKLLDGLE